MARAELDVQTDIHIQIPAARFQITPAVTCIVGEWKMEVDTKLQGDGALSYSLPGGIFILFNPWCPGVSKNRNTASWLFSWHLLKSN